MNKNKFSIKSIPGWAYMLVIFGFLYLSGLHTEAIGQVQRVLLATGIMQPNLPEIPTAETTVPENASETKLSAETTAANDFILQDLNGKTIKFSSLRNKVIFMNIWA